MENILTQAFNFGFPAGAFVVLFFIYRQDAQRYEKNLTEINARMASLLETTTKSVTAMEQSVSHLTQILREK